ncbi:hypothetical protein K402DRAFT_176667 [Aulographum hederae CBS 113979]|uniref:Uncharacterized protein n=1 Tax=Aulographum hederae CBS 113979 TaxID=1176131 RepID=A0A6G1GQS7_9PEZI|nr:hypothetical protein K402DRAFT_176667 [Aulographum hederae CBS 113979]
MWDGRYVLTGTCPATPEAYESIRVRATSSVEQGKPQALTPHLRRLYMTSGSRSNSPPDEPLLHSVGCTALQPRTVGLLLVLCCVHQGPPRFGGANGRKKLGTRSFEAENKRDSKLQPLNRRLGIFAGRRQSRASEDSLKVQVDLKLEWTFPLASALTGLYRGDLWGEFCLQLFGSSSPTSYFAVFLCRLGFRSMKYWTSQLPCW